MDDEKKMVEKCEGQGMDKSAITPVHYEASGLECIDVMEAVFGNRATMEFCRLNAFKYIWRSERKNGAEDIGKAIWYLNKYLGYLEGNGERNGQG